MAMTLSRVQSVFTYRTTLGSSIYNYDVVINSSGTAAIRNIRGPRGLITDSMTALPQDVIDDINLAIERSKLSLLELEVVSGTIDFEAETSKSVTITEDLLNTTAYRVSFSSSSGASFRVSNKTTTGFDVESSIELGTEDEPEEVEYIIFVSTATSSDLGGVLEFNAEDNGTKSVVFETAMPTSNYKVILTPSNFFTAKVTNKSKSGFTVVIGYTLVDDETAEVGYDVVV